MRILQSANRTSAGKGWECFNQATLAAIIGDPVTIAHRILACSSRTSGGPAGW
jgi:hypothetical protein